MKMNCTEAALMLHSISVYNGIKQRSIIKGLDDLLNSVNKSVVEFVDAYSRFFSLLCERGCTENFLSAIIQTALFDENCFTRAAAAGSADKLPNSVLSAVKSDMYKLITLGKITPDDLILNRSLPFLPRWKTGDTPMIVQENDIIKALENFHRKNGCGMFARYKAFVWRNGGIKPVVNFDKIDIDSLKGYELQRGKIIDNTKAFMDGKTCNNCLLYGDKGTGKSSTVKAAANHFRDLGLRIVEIPKERLMDFPLLIDEIAKIPMKFIIFIDDLSFLQQDENYASLKAVLEGGLASRPDNALIYATSNRRHLIKECFSDRDTDDVNRRDNMEESLSLSDRFGLSVAFKAPNKEKYLEIVLALADQYGINVNKETICAGAEKFALERGGRSPRCAKQYVESLFRER